MTAERPKILLSAFTSLPAPNGLACWLEQQVKYLAGYYDVDVLTVKTQDLSHIERMHGARVLRVPVDRSSATCTVTTFQRAMVRQLDSEDYKLCHFHSLWDGLVLVSHEKRYSYRLIYEPRALNWLEFKALHPRDFRALDRERPLKDLEQYCFKQADAVIVHSMHMQNRLVDSGVPPAKIEVMYPAVAPETFDSSEHQRQLGSILYIGSLAPWQGISTLLRAMTELPASLPVRLAIVCPDDDPARKELEGKVHMMGLQRKVDFLAQADWSLVPALVGRFDVCVAPLADHERNRAGAGFPHKLLVYLAGRRPVIVSRMPFVEEVLTDGLHAAMFQPGDFRGLARLIEMVITDRQLASGLANRARMLVEEKLSPVATGKRLLKLYRELLAYEEDTDRIQVAAPADTDTQPVMPVLPDDDQDTRPAVLPGCSEDTVELLVGPVPSEGADTTPGAEGGGEILFRAVEEQASDSTAAEWKVTPLSEVERSGAADDREQTGSDDRWLLGGPSYPLKFPPARRQPASAQTPIEVSDSDVEPLDGTTPLAAGVPQPPPLPRKTSEATRRSERRTDSTSSGSDKPKSSR